MKDSLQSSLQYMLLSWSKSLLLENAVLRQQLIILQCGQDIQRTGLEPQNAGKSARSCQDGAVEFSWN